jgi:hypothetical protein
MHPLQCPRSCLLLMISLLTKPMAEGFPFLLSVILCFGCFWAWISLCLGYCFCVTYENILEQSLGGMTYAMHWVSMVIFPPIL